MDVDMRNWTESAHDRYCGKPFECGIEPPPSINLQVS